MKMQIDSKFTHIYAIDFGLKKIGIAHLVNNIALPLPPIIRKNRTQAARDLKNLLTQNGTLDSKEITLIIGVTSFSANDFLVRIKHFLSLLEFNGKVIFTDENLSSLEAEQKILDRKKEKKQNIRKNGTLDSLSACIILERYIGNNTKYF